MLPSPSSSFVLPPQQKTVPSVLSAQEWRSPSPTCWMQVQTLSMHAMPELQVASAQHG
jgi:hypothetical protein